MVDDQRLRNLEDRVTVLEREVEGEKTVTRQILQLAQDNAKDIADVRGVLRGLSNDVRGVVADIGGIRKDMDALHRAFPKMAADEMRKVLEERDDR